MARGWTLLISIKVILCLLLLSPSTALSKPRIGEPAPDFSAMAFDGTKISLADFRGKVLVVNIWATWCVPCRKELPLLDGYMAAMASHGLGMIAITTEDSVPASQLKPLQAVLRFPLARKFRGPYGAINAAVPTNYVIDRSGVLRYAAPGAFDLDKLNEILVPLLREPVPQDNPASGPISVRQAQ